MISQANPPPHESPFSSKSSNPSNQPNSTRTPKEQQAISCIARYLSTLTANYPASSTIEIRAVGCTERFRPKPHVIAGFFSLDNLSAAADAAFDLQRKNSRGVYFTLNPVNVDLLSRRANRVESISDRDSISALDSDIVCRRWILIDADPVRTSGVSSSDAEKNAAREVIDCIAKCLSEKGWPLPITADSGNGYHLLYRIDLHANDDGLIRNCLRALAAQHDNPAVHVDTTVFNPARICKLYGTISRKGDSTPERPHRFSKIIGGPKSPELVPTELLQQLAATAPPEKSHSTGTAAKPGRSSKGKFGSRRSTKSPAELAALYLDKIPPAISGQGGHSQTYHAAGVLIDGFALSIADALPLLQSWNVKCEPPWSDADLERKLLEAEKNLGRSGKLLEKLESIRSADAHARPVNSVRDLILITETENETTDETAATGAETTKLTIPADLSLIYIENRNDLANGRRLVSAFGHEMRYFHAWHSWLTFTGTHWKRDATAEVQRKAKQVALSLWNDAFSPEVPEGDAEECIGFARYTSSVKAIGEMLKAASSEPSIPVTASDLDSSYWDLNCPNGTLDLRTGTLRSHSPADLITKISATPYIPEMETPIWDQFLSDIFAGNAELISYVQRLFGYCLTGDVSEHILAVFHGGGENGKSTLLNTIMEIVGNDYAMKAPADFLMAKYGDAHPTEKADLFGRRLVSASETKEGQKIDEALVKELTGGDNVRARRMREDFWEFRPTHKLLLTTNHRPVVSGTDRGIWRRMRLIPFNVTIAAEKKDRNLPDKLKAEYPGILAWMVRGCLEWQNGGLRDPNEVLLATSEYRNSQDVLQGFIDERCLIGGNYYRVKLRSLFKAYKEWSEDSGERPVTEKKFSMSMVERGFKKEKSSSIWFTGICLKEIDDDEQDSEDYSFSDPPDHSDEQPRNMFSD